MIQDLKELFKDINSWSVAIVEGLQTHFESKFKYYDEAPSLKYWHSSVDTINQAYFVEVEVQNEEYSTIITLHFYYNTNEIDVTSRNASCEHMEWAWEFMETKGKVRKF